MPTKELDKKGESMAAWSDLPTDVLEHLTSFLPLPDYHRFSAVCQNWWIAAKPRLHCPAKKLPWLLVRGERDPHKRRVFSISENRHYNIDFSKMQGHYICGSSHGWLFTIDIDLNFQLLNPLTGRHYNLPPIPMYDRIIRFVREVTGDANDMTYDDVQARVVYKAILDYDPAQRSDFTVLILYGDQMKRLAFWRPDNLVWTLIEGNYFSFHDITYFKGHFYGTSTYRIYPAKFEIGVTYIVDVGQDPKVTRVAPEVRVYDLCKIYLVDFRGELLLLQRYRLRTSDDCHITRAFFGYTLDLEKGKYYPRHHLDGYSLFLGHNAPLVVNRDQSPGCNENCIYFIARINHNDKKYGRIDNGIYNLVKKTIRPYYPREIYHPEIVGPIWWTPNPW